MKFVLAVTFCFTTTLLLAQETKKSPILMNIQLSGGISLVNSSFYGDELFGKADWMGNKSPLSVRTNINIAFNNLFLILGGERYEIKHVGPNEHLDITHTSSQYKLGHKLT